MNKIFIEAKDKRTSEYYFLKTILNQFFPDKEVDFIPMNGIGNLFLIKCLLLRIAESK